jgi:dipeptidyl aminopeptidase/acylaminoacyl peptidase
MPILDLEALLNIPFVDSDHPPAISPDGMWAAYSANDSGQWEIYLVRLKEGGVERGETSDTGDDTTGRGIRQVSQGEGGKFAPVWFPDGKHLAFAVDRNGSEQHDIYCWSVEDGKLENLTPDTEESIEAEFSISPDGERIALISDRSGRFEAYVVSVKGGDWKKAAEFEFPVCGVRWSPNGRWLAVTVAGRGEDYYTYLVSMESGEQIAIGDANGPINARQAYWSPDSSMLVFSSNLKGYYNIGLYDIGLRRYAWLTSGKGDKEHPVWSPDGRRIAFILGQGPKNSLAAIDLILRETAVCRHEPGVYHRPAFTPDGKTLVFSFENPRNPPSLYRLTLPDGIPIRLTHSVPAQEFGNYFVLPEEVEYRSLDGRMVPALLFKPAEASPESPAVVYVHGGPNWLTMINWDAFVQHLVSRGWVVIAPNYRGSTGYGQEWQVLSRFDLGGGETRDVVAAADYLIQQRLAHPERIAVTGRSHGGYLTMTCLTQYPDRWAGGAAVVPFLNWFTAHQNSRQDLQHWDLENFGDPQKDTNRYYERSPFFFLEKIMAPVQLICGTNDPRCPASESLEAHRRLTELGKDVELHLYEGEGHFFMKRENVMDAKLKQAAFLARVLEEVKHEP